MTGDPRDAQGRPWKLIATVVAAAIVQTALLAALFFGYTNLQAEDEPDVIEDWATQADGVVAAIESIAEDPSAMVADQVRADLLEDPSSLSNSATYDARRDSWVSDGIGGGVIEVTVTESDGTSADYLAVMVKEDDAWKVLSTVAIR
ncbi:hypothetical protein CH289_18005 [Rhodococcus sp. RS1C4]|uniref:hypothetical protein n=1 Tax=Rhodococcoides fascians TaxID=1828 RepID=UPI000562034E|nr:MULTISPECIES: hypothetical protein [Rhodococcus]OZC49074.1 hypothetical protein CH289_18005 [Rhodococcus sp. RS1C4]